MTKLSSGTIAHDSASPVAFTPEADGAYLLGVSAGSCAYSVVSSNAPIGLYTGDGLSLIYGVKRLYFRVPGHLKQFAISATGWGAETVRVNVFAPDGKQVATGQTTTKQRNVKVAARSDGHEGGVWSLEITRADTGVLEDNTIRLGRELPPVLALRPEEVFRREGD